MYTILKAINTNKVDYFSLDVEGCELEVLKGINLKKLDITTFSVEHNNYQDQKIKNTEKCRKWHSKSFGAHSTYLPKSTSELFKEYCDRF